MQALTITIKQTLTLILLSVLNITLNPVMAKSDMEMMGEVQKAREMSQKHINHKKPVKENQKFRGVYYGYLPCKDCDGIKTMLSLKNKNNYLLVTQPARNPSREYFDKGKYIWDDKVRTVTLISRKNSEMKKYHIKDEGTLIQHTADGGVPIKNDSDKYALRRGDTVKTRAVHIH